jgi:hypothetical protein
MPAFSTVYLPELFFDIVYIFKKRSPLNHHRKVGGTFLAFVLSFSPIALKD